MSIDHQRMVIQEKGVFVRGCVRKVPDLLVKETVVQFLGTENRPFSSVALVEVFGNETLMTAFVTDRHKDGSYTVFVPTGPNPMSGNIYHLEREFVHPVEVPVEVAMRSIISCGAGSARIIEAYDKEVSSWKARQGKGVPELPEGPRVTFRKSKTEVM